MVAFCRTRFSLYHLFDRAGVCSDAKADAIKFSWCLEYRQVLLARLRQSIGIQQKRSIDD